MAERGGDAGSRPPRGAKPPKAAYRDLARRYGVSRGELHEALEKIKGAVGLPPNANTRVDAEGNVYIEKTGEWIGNLSDEV